MRDQVLQKIVIAISLALPAINLYAQQGLPSAATTITGTVPMAATALTAVPALVPYSGVALGRSGSPVTGESSVTFLIFKNQQGGEALFTESQMIGFDEGGHYKVQLGAANTNGLPPGLFSSGEARWLEVQIAGQPIEPRVLLSSVPYALKAADAATLGGLPASAFMLATSPSVSTFQSAVTPDAATSVTTTGGTTGTLPYFTGSSTVLPTLLYYSAGGLGIGKTPAAPLDVNGKAVIRGILDISRSADATSATGEPSFPFFFQASAYNSSSKVNVLPYFQFQSEATGNNTASPGATMNILYNNGTGNTNETGFYINPNGTLHFASGQTFPDTITGVKAGNGLTGGGTSGDPTVAINTATIPTLSGNNTFTGTDTFTASINENVDINIDNTNKNTGNVSPGLRFGNASGEAISSQRTGDGSNQYGLDFYTDYTRRISILESGDVEIGAVAALSGNPSATLTLEDDGGADQIVLDAEGQGGDCNIDLNANLSCSGTIYGAAKDFKIDHPLDPANKYLVHGSVESSEMLNIYSGNATTDGSGSATVTLPDWFQAENGDFRYQLTTVGQDAHAWVSQEVSGGLFKISTSATNVKVSWQITAVRQDAYAKAHPLVAEQKKTGKELGFYQHPELFGQPKEKGIAWTRRATQTKAAKASLAPR